ncbi:hypothetical protein [Algirhabdus cladophorae]|uniref:hypothetical protein n=1 Tax=Algirhabdus cladophorae TaxID=3377108 RepID=UPI003B84555A
MKNLTIALSLISALSIASPVYAGSYSKAAGSAASGTKVLTVVPNLCPGTIAVLKTWAKTATSIAAYAVPTALPGVDVSCDNPGRPVTAGQSFNAPSVKEAQAAAIGACETARDENNGPCVVLGTVTTR